MGREFKLRPSPWTPSHFAGAFVSMLMGLALNLAFFNYVFLPMLGGGIDVFGPGLFGVCVVMSGIGAVPALVAGLVAGAIRKRK